MHAAPVELGNVARVVYFAGGVEVGQVAEPPYEFAWTSDQGGDVVLRAEARSSDASVLGSTQRTVQVVGEGLQVMQSSLQVSVPTGGTSTVTVDMRNLGPGETKWALHVQGGSAPFRIGAIVGSSTRG